MPVRGEETAGLCFPRGQGRVQEKLTFRRNLKNESGSCRADGVYSSPSVCKRCMTPVPMVRRERFEFAYYFQKR